jgi:hypothetical protein
MKFRILICGLMLGVSSSLMCQEISLGMTTGISTYSMTDMKALNEALYPDFDAKLVSDFPPYVYFQPDLKFTWVRISLSLEYTYFSTGSRISAKDYSGEYRLDMLVHSNNAGIMLGWELIRKNKVRLMAGVKGGMAFSGLKAVYYLELNNSVKNEFNNKLKAIHYYFEPCLDLDYYILPKVSLGLQGGYYFDIGNKPFKSDFTLTNPETGYTVGPDWKGIRIGIAVSYVIR